MKRTEIVPRAEAVAEILAVLDRALAYRPRSWGYGISTAEHLMHCLVPDHTWSDDAMRAVVRSRRQS